MVALVTAGAARAVPTPPEGRAYEKVSPDEKNSADVLPATDNVRAGIQTSLDGNEVVYAAYGSFADNPSSPIQSQYLASRGTNTWASFGISPPLSTILFASTSSGVPIVSEDLDHAVVATTAPLDPNAPPPDDFPLGLAPLYRADLEAASYELITPQRLDGTAPYTPNLLGGSADLSHVLFETDAALTADAMGVSGSKVYKWTTGGTVTLESVLPDGTPVAGSGGGPLFFPPGAPNELVDNAISEDGSATYFTAPPGAGGGALYRRQNGDSVLVNAEENSLASVPEGPATFRGAIRDGSKALFTSDQPLVDDDVDSGSDLYLYTHTANPALDSNLTLLSPDAAGDGVAAGVVAFDDDASHVYFTTDSGTRLWLWETGQIKEVSDVLNEDFADSNREFDREWRDVTPDGSVLLFASRHNPTGFDNTSAACAPANRCVEIFRYDAETSTPTEPDLECVSCNLQGTAPLGNARLYADGNFDPTGLFESRDRRNMSDDGDQVFFETFDTLVPADSNQRLDVYAWKDGVLNLISTGASSSNSYFGEVSPSGNDVFFTTRERLVGSDRDHVSDLYDARVNGGLASQNQVPEPQCEGDACQADPSSPLASEDIGSSSHHGSGNPGPGRDCDRFLEKALKKLERAQKASTKKAKKLRKQAKKLKKKHKRCKRVEAS